MISRRWEKDVVYSGSRDNSFLLERYLKPYLKDGVTIEWNYGDRESFTLRMGAESVKVTSAPKAEGRLLMLDITGSW